MAGSGAPAAQTPDAQITVHKLNVAGEETWTYSGRLLHRGRHSLTLEALYDREDANFHGLWLRHGDRFVETHYADRWYNVFAIHDVDSGGLKGWYCNIVRPARFEPGHIWSVDLALDLVVLPDGRSAALDEDEFAALRLAPEERAQAQRTLEQLKQDAERREGDFTAAGD
jgi:hypothetical protein